MKAKFLKLFMAFTMLFTLFAVPKMEVKANETVTPYASYRQVIVNDTKNGTFIHSNTTINFTVKVSGTYLLSTTGDLSNIDVITQVTRTPSNSPLTAYVKRVAQSKTTNNKLQMLVTIGFKYGNSDISGTKQYTFVV